MPAFSRLYSELGWCVCMWSRGGEGGVTYYSMVRCSVSSVVRDGRRGRA
jgi:hypothetical protein